MEKQRFYKFYGFHGTAESCANNILETKEFELGEPREDHWLGQGAYFFKDDEEQAVQWAISKVTNSSDYKGETPYVIEVILEAIEENVLNLDSRKGLNYLDSHIKKLRSEGIVIEYNENDEKSSAKVRCFLLSLVSDEIWMIQRSFPVKSIFDKKELFSQMQLNLIGAQVCVRNKNVINGNSINGKEIKLYKRNKRKEPRRLSV
ncbi:hypothetical protein LG296_01475 [Ureibacillus chungkukjangi]|uniref:hypothetical protein n=1 Tax=Ureibacillus chungkukjangi TaxID=1202712 RepID=UPI003851687C